MKKIIIMGIVGSVVASLLTCSPIRIAGGAGEETTNGRVKGIILDSLSKPVSRAMVQLIPVKYDPLKTSMSVLTDTTDSLGRFEFDRLESGEFNIRATSAGRVLCALTTNVNVNRNTVEVSPMTIRAIGAIKVMLTAAINAADGYVFIPGTGLFTYLLGGRTDYAIIDSVPAGVIPSIAYSALNSSIVSIIRSLVSVNPGDTTTVYNPFWEYSKRMILNTTPSGANVAGNVENFPVLIRLTSSNFNFSQAQSAGADIRFTKSDNAILPREIERWDPGAEFAEVWVKVDTIYGNNRAQFITMYWGNPNAADSSNSAAVFDTADDFQGVWHLGDASGDPIRDASANRYNGVSPDTARPSAAEGIIGTCRAFDGKSDFIMMPNTANSKLSFPQNGNYTVSAWVSLDTFDNAPQCIVSKGYEQYFLRSTYYPSTSPSWEFVEFDETTNWQSSRSPASNRNWVFLAGVRQGSNQFLYCNGIPTDSTKDVWPRGISRNASNDLSIGGFLKEVTVPANDGYCFFKGSIDEVRIINAAQGPEWVRLCYMNQRADDRLVEFK